FGSGGETGSGLSDLSGLPDACPVVLFYDHCSRISMAGDIFLIGRDPAEKGQQPAELVCAYRAFVLFLQYDHHKRRDPDHFCIIKHNRKIIKIKTSYNVKNHYNSNKTCKNKKSLFLYHFIQPSFIFLLLVICS